MNEKEIHLLYLFRDKLIKELCEMSKNDDIQKAQLIEYTYQKLTSMISALDERNISK